MSKQTVYKPISHLASYMLLLEISSIILIAYLPRSKFWRLVAFSPVFYFICCSLMSPTGNSTTDYSAGTIIATRAGTCFYLVFIANPLDNYRSDKNPVSPRSMPTLKRLWWAFCVFNNARGLGWNYNIRKIPPCPKHTRKSFIISRIGHCIGYFFLLDLSWTYARYSAYTGSFKMIPRNPHDCLLRAIKTLLWAAGVLAPLSLQYTILATICVAIGWTEPSEWPPVIGNLSDAYSLRNLWGRVWHQHMYRFFVGISRSVAHMIGYSPGSRGSSLIQLYLTFTLSALVHAAGDFMVDPRYLGLSAFFFIYQAIGITLEDAVLEAFSRSNIHYSPIFSRLLGYVWVSCWLFCTAQSFINAMVTLGMVKEILMPEAISPCTFVLKFVWKNMAITRSDTTLDCSIDDHL